MKALNFLRISKEKLIQANTLSQILPSFWKDLSMERVKRKNLEQTRKLYFALGCDAYPNSGYDLITNYVSVEVSVINQNIKLSAKSKNDTLTPEQKQILVKAEYGSELIISIYYMYKPSLAIKPHQNINNLTGKITLSVVPEQEAVFPENNKGLTNYFYKSVFDKVSKKDIESTYNCVLNFSIDDEGKAVNAFLSVSSSKAYIDKIILEAVAKMLTWKAAKNEKGIRVKQISQNSFWWKWKPLLNFHNQLKSILFTNLNFHQS
jgi:hypothetical protein